MLPYRNGLKTMTGSRHVKGKKKAMAMSITVDMWTSVNMDACLAVTSHYINDQSSLSHSLRAAVCALLRAYKRGQD